MRVFVAPGSSEGRDVGPALALRDFATGSEGSGPVGGAIEERAGRGSELPDMLEERGAGVGVLMPAAWQMLALACWRDCRLFFFILQVVVPLRHCTHVRRVPGYAQQSRTGVAMQGNRGVGSGGRGLTRSIHAGTLVCRPAAGRGRGRRETTGVGGGGG